MEHLSVLHLLLILGITGLVAGFVGAFFGVGGGTILVPVFLSLFAVTGIKPSLVMHFAIGTSLALTVPNGAVAALKQHRLGLLDLSEFKKFILFLIPGGVLGGIWVNYVPDIILKWVFTGYLLICLGLGFYKLHRSRQIRQMASKPGSWARSIGGLVIGCVSVMLGIAGGTLIVPFYTLYRYPIQNSIALSSASAAFVGATGAVMAMLSGWSLMGQMPHTIGFVDWAAFLVMTPLIMISSYWGAHTVSHMNYRLVEWLYTLFIGLLAIDMLYHVL